MDTRIFDDGDRVTHSVRGLGTICISPDARGLVVLSDKAAEAEPGHVFVVWDDERFPVEAMAERALERLPVGAMAISSGV
jgi:hypothetical protein